MAIGALANPEVRLINDPIFETPVYKSQYNLSGCDYGAEMADLPGFSYAGPAVEHFYAVTYPDQSQPSPIPSIASIPSPTTGIRTVLSHTSLGPTMEKLRAPSKSSSPPSSEKLAEDKFRSSQQQWDYDSARAIIESEQVKAGFTEYVNIYVVLALCCLRKLTMLLGRIPIYLRRKIPHTIPMRPFSLSSGCQGPSTMARHQESLPKPSWVLHESVSLS